MPRPFLHVSLFLLLCACDAWVGVSLCQDGSTGSLALAWLLVLWYGILVWLFVAIHTTSSQLPKALTVGPQAGTILAYATVRSLWHIAIGRYLWLITQILGAIYMLTEPALVSVGQVFSVTHILWRIYRYADRRMPTGG